MFQFLKNRFACGVLPALLLPFAPLALADDGARELPTVTVYGSAPTDAARAEAAQVPGAVSVVDAAQWSESSARTLKDMLDFTAGVFAQPKWGEDTRLSIRGSGLSRNFHLRGVQLYQDGVPLNAADGSADFQEIDPTAFRYTEVYKGANALRLGANTLGGALNFVTRTAADGEPAQLRVDVGSFDFYRLQLSGGQRVGDFDAYATGSWLKLGGYRDHSDGESLRGAANFGWAVSEALSTRFYVSGGDIEQRMPGSVSKRAALDDPRDAAAGNLALDSQRNMRTWRVANKTTFKADSYNIEYGGAVADKQLIHPIFQFLDYEYRDYSAFGRIVFPGKLGGYDNRLTLGASTLFGKIGNTQFRNAGNAERGERLSASEDRSRSTALYAEDAFSLTPQWTLIAAVQHFDAERKRSDEFDDSTPDTSGKQDYRFTNPKFGVLWQLQPSLQLFANVSRSGEAPSFGELNFTNAALADTKAQRATTFEAGTRGERGKLAWDVSVYREQIRNAFQFFDLGGGNYQVENADRTIHQGIEAAVHATLTEQLFGTVRDALVLDLAWTYNDFAFDDDDSWGSNDLPGAPHQYLRSALRYQHPGGYYLAPDVEWVPQGYFVDNANSLRTDAYALLGLRAGYDAGRRWALAIDARNLLDRRYIASSSTAGAAAPTAALFEPGTGFAISAALTVRW